MKTVLIIRALLVAIASVILSLYINNPTITALTLGIIYLGFLANLITYRLITKRDNEAEASYHSAHSLQ